MKLPLSNGEGPGAMRIAGSFPNLPPVPRFEPTIGLVRRAPPVGAHFSRRSLAPLRCAGCAAQTASGVTASGYRRHSGTRVLRCAPCLARLAAWRRGEGES